MRMRKIRRTLNHRENALNPTNVNLRMGNRCWDLNKASCWISWARETDIN